MSSDKQGKSWGSAVSEFLKSKRPAITMLLMLLAYGLNLVPSDFQGALLARSTALVVLGFILLSILAEIHKKVTEFGGTFNADESGIEAVLPSLEGDKVQEVLRRNGRIVILNTWIFNLSSITSALSAAIRQRDATVEFCVLKAESQHAKNRSDELGGRDVGGAITANLHDLSTFCRGLNKHANAVKIFEFDSALKLSLYGNEERAIIGFYFPETMAAEGPQICIKGRSGDLSSKVWEYYDNLPKTDITERVLNLVASGRGIHGQAQTGPAS